MQSTLAFAPSLDELEEHFFDTPVLTLSPQAQLATGEEESEQGEP